MSQAVTAYTAWLGALVTLIERCASSRAGPTGPIRDRQAAEDLAIRLWTAPEPAPGAYVMWKKNIHIAPWWALVVGEAANYLASMGLLHGVDPVLASQLAFGASCTETMGYKRVAWMGAKWPSGKSVVLSDETLKSAYPRDDGLGNGQIISSRWQAMRASLPPQIASLDHTYLAHPGVCALAMVSTWAKGFAELSAGHRDLDGFANFWPGRAGGGWPKELEEVNFATAPAVTKTTLRLAGARKMTAIFAPLTYAQLRGTLPPFQPYWMKRAEHLRSHAVATVQDGLRG